MVLSADSPTGSGSLLEGEIALFEVTGATRVELTTLSGDADLEILVGSSFDTADTVCDSINGDLELDACDLPSTSERAFASVDGLPSIRLTALRLLAFQTVS